MASVIRRGLKAEGIPADVASRGDEAISRASFTHYDAIVLDVMLPGMDGFDVCRRLREDGNGAPVIMVTARDSVEDRRSTMDCGADDYIVKPYSFEELVARVCALSRRGRRSRIVGPPES